MITRITGILQQVSSTAAVMEVGPLWLQLLVPASSIDKLTDLCGRELTLHTVLHIDGDPARGNLAPKLFGFRSEADRDFWQLLTTVKGIGARKALRAMARPAGEIAAMIVAEDEKMLTLLPEIGKRTAQQIVAELKDKADKFVTGEFAPQGESEARQSGSETMSESALEAISVLVQLGEKRTDAVALIQRVMAVAESEESPEALIQHAFKIKAGGPATGR